MTVSNSSFSLRPLLFDVRCQKEEQHTDNERYIVVGSAGRKPRHALSISSHKAINILPESDGFIKAQ